MRLYHLSFERPGRLLRAAMRSFVAGEPLVPQMLEQCLGQIPLGLRPLAVRFAHAEVHLEHQRPVQVVHQLDELVALLGDQMRILVCAEPAAGDVQLAALVERAW